MKSSRPLLIFGTGDLARSLSRCMREDSDLRQIAFCVDEAYIDDRRIDDLEVVPFERVSETHPPSEVDILVATGYHRVNSSRAEIVERCKQAGYSLSSYIGSQVIKCSPLEHGENCIIFSGANLHPFVSLGDNVVIWGNCHVGHHTRIESHVFIACGSVAGRSHIGGYTFLGCGSWVTDGVTVGKSNIIGAGVTISHDTGDNEVYRLPKAKPSPVSSKRMWM